LFSNPNNPKKIELLVPAGDFEKLEIAMHYGADAVYLAGKNFSLRNFSGNFTDRELGEAISLARSKNVKVYVACNAFARNSQLTDITDFLLTMEKLNPDGIIIADPGVIHLAGKICPRIPIHLSTQANTTNLQSALFWQEQGVKRINVARELPLADIQEIAAQNLLEVEVFVHGAMCIAYSGRCLLSNYMASRDANQGMCAHPCRWKYAVVEEQRPDQYMPIAEDDRGAYIFSSRDLCMISHIPELVRANITSLKIEGRM
jgi:putative protease